MAETKEELLEDLYGLRAGLSVYSEEAEKVSQIEDESWGKEKEQLEIAARTGTNEYHRGTPFSEVELFHDNKYVRCPTLKKLISENHLDVKIFVSGGSYYPEDPTPEIEKKCSEQTRLVEKVYEKWLFSDEMESLYLENVSASNAREAEQVMDGKQGGAFSYSCQSSNRNAELLKAIISLLFTVGMAVVFFLFGLPRDDFWKWVMLGGVILFAIFFFVFLIKFLRYNKQCKRLKTYVKECRRNAEHPEQSEKMLAVYAAREKLKTLIAEREGKAYPYVMKLDHLYKALQKEYASTLDERNWKNLDLVIFALEAGRADTLKEALQFVDGETHTRRIERAIETATSQICSTIRSGFASLEATVQNCCNRLSAQIQDIGGRLLATNQQILSTQREMLTEQRFSNALLAKANVTSAQLMDDVHKIRSNSDYLNMRLRNG